MPIDRQLTEAGWSVQDGSSLNLFAAQGVYVDQSEIVEDLTAALVEFETVAAALEASPADA